MPPHAAVFGLFILLKKKAEYECAEARTCSVKCRSVLMCFAHVYIPSQNHKGCEKCHVQWRQVLHILLIKEFMEEK